MKKKKQTPAPQKVATKTQEAKKSQSHSSKSDTIVADQKQAFAIARSEMEDVGKE